MPNPVYSRDLAGLDWGFDGDVFLNAAASNITDATGGGEWAFNGEGVAVLTAPPAPPTVTVRACVFSA